MQRTTIHGNRLERMIGIPATSSVVKAEPLKRSIERFSKWKIPVCIADQVHRQKRYFAGSDEERAAALHAFATDSLVGTIWCARGGYGATRLLPLLEKWKTALALRKDPKLLIGYSDVTALHLYFYEKLALPTLHAVMPGTPRFGKISPRHDALLRRILSGELELGKKSYTSDWATKAFLPVKKEAEGVILGGNLSLVTSLIGTPWQPDLRGKILFLEDCAEAPYRVDRMLTQMANAGMFQGLRGVLLGDFEADVVYKEAREKRYWKEVFRERFEPLGIPVLHRLPVGHGKQNEPLPLGVRAAITRQGKLLLLEQPVRR